MYDSVSRRQTLVKAADDRWWLSTGDIGDKGLDSARHFISVVCEGVVVGKLTSKVRSRHPSHKNTRLLRFDTKIQSDRPTV